MLEIEPQKPKVVLNLELPPIAQIQSIQDYFRQFYDLNKVHSDFTYRSFSEFINWPHSYLSDLMAGRKPLTLSRALEFSTLVQLKPLETERLIVMSYKDSENPVVKTYFQEQFELNWDLNLKTTPSTMGGHSEQNQVEVIRDVECTSAMMILGSIISWYRQPISKLELDRICSFYSEVIGEDEKAAALETLEKYGSIRREADEFVFVKDVYFVSPPAKLKQGTEIMNQILGRCSELEASGKGRLPYRQGLVEFPISRFAELEQRICNLANWVGSVSRAACRSENYNPHENPLIKYDFFSGAFLPQAQLQKIFGNESKDSIN